MAARSDLRSIMEQQERAARDSSRAHAAPTNAWLRPLRLTSKASTSTTGSGSVNTNSATSSEGTTQPEGDHNVIVKQQQQQQQQQPQLCEQKVALESACVPARGVRVLKVFAIRSKRGSDGQLARIVREHYLREDISCHSELCPRATCHHQRTPNDATLSSGPPSSSISQTNRPPSSRCLSSSARRYIIPDCDCFALFLECFEHSDWQDVIILRTVLNCMPGISNPSSAKSRRVRRLLESRTRRFVLIENEHCIHTFRPYVSGEPEATRNAKALWKAASWLSSHWDHRMPLVLVGAPGPRSTPSLLAHTASSIAQQTESAVRLSRDLEMFVLEWGARTCNAGSASDSGRTDDKRNNERKAGNATGAAQSESGMGNLRALEAEVLALYRALLLSEEQRRAERHARDEELRSRVLEHELLGPASGVLNSIESVRLRALGSGGGVTRSGGGSGDGGVSGECFSDYFPEPVLEAGLRSGSLLRGHIHVMAGRIAVLDLGGASNRALRVTVPLRAAHPVGASPQPRDQTIHKSPASLSELTGSKSLDAAAAPELKDGTSVPETMTVSLDGVHEVLVLGDVARNRAVDGDEVVVQLFPPSLWAQKRTYDNDDADAGASTADDGLRAGSSSEDLPLSQLAPTGHVVGVLQRNWRAYVCTLQASDGNSGGNETHQSSESSASSRADCEVVSGRAEDVLLVPMARHVPKIRVRTRQRRELQSARVLARIDDWPASSKYPNGHFVSNLGPYDSWEVAIRCLCLEHDVKEKGWSPEAIASLPQRVVNLSDAEPFKWTVPAHALVGRLDLRTSYPDSVVSIDPPTCVDIDDALSVWQLPNGNFQFGCHIADATAFIAAGSALDLEARERSTTVYLTDRKMGMLPSVLGDDLCSLRGGTERLCVSVLWEMKPPLTLSRGIEHSKTVTADEASVAAESGWQLVGTRFARTAVKSFYALSYETAQIILDRGRAQQPFDRSMNRLERKAPDNVADATKLCSKIGLLMKVARQIRRERVHAGAVELESFRVELELDAHKRPTAVVHEKHMEVHDMVAEWMIFANKSVAQRIFECFPECALLRHHPQPKQHKFRALRTCAEGLGLEIDTSSNRALAESLARAQALLRSRGSSDWATRVMRALATGAMAEAQYISTGQFKLEQFYHYGLAAEFYTHFTSPIRRYADQIVHRLLLEAIKQADADTSSSSSASTALSLSLSLSQSQSRPPPSLQPPFIDSELREVAAHINERHRNAKHASQECQSLFLARFLQSLIRDRANKNQLQPSHASSSTTSSSSSTHPGTVPLELQLLSRAHVPDAPEAANWVCRAEALVFAFRPKSVHIMVPALSASGNFVLSDSAGRLVASLPPSIRETIRGRGAGLTVTSESPDELAPECAIERKGLSHLTVSLMSSGPSQDLSPSRLELHLFDRVLVDVFLETSRYHFPMLSYRLVWHEPLARSSSSSNFKSKLAIAGATSSAGSGSETGSDNERKALALASAQVSPPERNASLIPRGCAATTAFLKTEEAKQRPLSEASENEQPEGGLAVATKPRKQRQAAENTNIYELGTALAQLAIESERSCAQAQDLAMPSGTGTSSTSAAPPCSEAPSRAPQSALAAFPLGHGPSTIRADQHVTSRGSRLMFGTTSEAAAAAALAKAKRKALAALPSGHHGR